MADKITKLQYIFSTDCDCKEVMSKALSKGAEGIINDLLEADLRGRGGAGFLTGLKWKLAREQKDTPKYVICNADEGEPGTFKDRKILQEVPGKVLSGMALCGYTIGSTKGIIYLRAEYNYLKNHLQKAIEKHRREVLEPLGLDFEITIFSGAGAYVCGEETALIESIEGERGEPRNKPPFPVQKGLFGKPTVVNNVETFATTMTIFRIGTDAYKKLGRRDELGTKLICVSGDTPKPGVYEIGLGTTIEEFVNEFGDGNTKAVLVGGYAGICVPETKFKKTIIGSRRYTEKIPGAAMIILNHQRSMYRVLHNVLEFFAEESCGQCTPCRVGYQQLLKGIEAIKAGDQSPEYLDTLVKLSETMQITAKCGLGQSAPNIFKSVVENFREEIVY